MLFQTFSQINRWKIWKNLSSVANISKILGILISLYEIVKFCKAYSSIFCCCNAAISLLHRQIFTSIKESRCELFVCHVPYLKS